MIRKTKIIAVAAALTVTAPLAAWAAVGFPGTPLSTAVCSPVGPSDVVNTPMAGDREVSVTWDPRSLLNCGVTGYNVVVIDSQGRPQQVVATAQSDAAGVYVRGLNLCTFYRFGVQAKYPGHVSEVSFPAKPAFVSGPPDKSPPVITVIVTGTSTSGPADSFSPSTASFCTSPNGVMPSQNGLPSLRNLADSWLNDTGGKTDKSSRTSGAGNNLIDSMAATGGYVLPYSYTGINMTGTAANPMLTVGIFTGKNVADANPLGACSDPTCHWLGEPPLLQASLASIHKTFPHTPIIVIGHSLGGLIAEQWWLQYSSNNTQGVIQVISLDSPLNGVAAGGACATGLCGPSGNPLYSVVGYDPGIAYTGLWAHQGDPAGSGPYANNQTALALDSSNHLFTAIGDLGDPLYDVGDYPASHFITGVKNIGLMSQVFWTEPSCVQSGYDLSSAECTATGQAIINPCGHAMNDGTGPLFDVPSGSMWIHSNVKNCPQVIDDALGWYHHYASAHPAPSPSSPTPSPSPSATPTTPPATQATVMKTFEPWVADGKADLKVPAPGLLITNVGTATCDSGSNDDPGSALAVHCNPPSNGTPCFINDTGDPGSPLLCSSDPTSKQVIEVTPATPNGIPIAMLNHSDPSAPAWFLILADGRKCAFLGYGTNTNVLSYNCGGNLGATIPDRSQPTWTVQEGTIQLNPTPSATRVAVVTAYR
jgi:hypothetical protein